MKTIFVPLLLSFSLSVSAQDFMDSPFQDLNLNFPIAADFNNDGEIDVIGLQTTFADPNTSLLLLNEPGNTPISFSVQNLGFNVEGQPVAADLDGDGNMDFIAVQKESKQIFLFENNGEANFTPVDLMITGVQEFKVIDMDNDSDLDIIGIHHLNDAAMLYINDGNQNFSTVEIIPASEDQLRFLEVADLDNDNDLDFIVLQVQSSIHRMFAYENDGNNNFNNTVLIEENQPVTSGILTHDMDSDGRVDILVLRYLDCDILRNEGNFNFEHELFASGPDFLRTAKVGDYNGDGRSDLVLATHNDGMVWYKNLSNAPLSVVVDGVSGIAPVLFLVNADLDQDGDLDLVASNGNFWWIENQIPKEPVGIKELSTQSLSVFPNPFSQQVYFDELSSHTHRYQLTDLYDQLLAQGVLTSPQLDLAQFPSGMYLLSVEDVQNQQIRRAKIIKQ